MQVMIYLNRYIIVQFNLSHLSSMHHLTQILIFLNGPISLCRYRILDEYPAEEFTEVYWIKFQKIDAARYTLIITFLNSLLI